MTPPYFAYGSNLDGPDLAAWCRARGFEPGLLRLRAPAYLPDHEPVFHYHSEARGGGALDVHARPGSAVAGALYDVAPGGWELLDTKEGAAQGRYARRDVHTLTADGVVVPARTYRVVPDRREGHVPPSAPYLQIVCRGLEALGHRTDAIRAAAGGEVPPSFPGAVFVYGTLMRGQVKAALLQEHAPTEVHAASVSGRLLSLGWYPGLIEAEAPEDRVHGEVFRFEHTDALISELDAYEDFLGYDAPDSLYHRVLRWVATARGPLLAWVYRYVGSTDGARVVASGRWQED